MSNMDITEHLVEAIDPGEFTSDYWQILEPEDRRRPRKQLAMEIAEAYAERVVRPDAPDAVFQDVAKHFAPEIEYNLP